MTERQQSTVIVCCFSLEHNEPEWVKIVCLWFAREMERADLGRGEHNLKNTYRAAQKITMLKMVYK